MKDRFMNGFVAGLIANIPVVILDFLASHFNLDKLDYIHFVSLLAFDDMSLNVWEFIFAFIIQSLFAGIMGIFFAYLIKLIRERYYYVKALVYSAFTWFAIYAVDIIFTIEDKAKIDFKTAVVHYLLSIIWGITMAWIVKWLEKKTDNTFSPEK